MLLLLISLYKRSSLHLGATTPRERRRAKRAFDQRLHDALLAKSVEAFFVACRT